MGGANGKLLTQAMQLDEGSITKAFNKYDTDKSGTLDPDESRLFIVDICDLMGEREVSATKRLGGDARGVQDRWDYAKDHALDIFKLIDKDNSGGLDRSEFSDFLANASLAKWTEYMGEIGYYKYMVEHKGASADGFKMLGLGKYL